MTEHDRAHRVLTTAFALFGGDGDVLAVGTHVRTRGDVRVAVDVADTKHARLILADSSRHVLFDARITAGESAKVTQWAGGTWEQRFVAADA